jgi:hypothetical protein
MKREWHYLKGSGLTVVLAGLVAWAMTACTAAQIKTVETDLAKVDQQVVKVLTEVCSGVPALKSAASNLQGVVSDAGFQKDVGYIATYAPKVEAGCAMLLPILQSLQPKGLPPIPPKATPASWLEPIPTMAPPRLVQVNNELEVRPQTTD